VKAVERLSAERLVADGQALVKERRFAEALERFAEASRAKPDYLPARVGQIRALKELERRDEARAAARALIDEHPEYGDVPFLRELEQGR
jgi:tetratricopeptide (TPR) repeat protein